MSKKLHNSLIDYLVAVGCDRDSGLVFKDKQCLNDENFYQIITNPIDPTILSVISGDLANYPASQNKINLNYPPLKLIRDVSFDLGNIEQNAKTKRDHYHRLSNIMSFESPIHSDILQNLPQFCFPNKCYASKLYIKPSIHSFVLTDIEGRKKYSMVLIYYREFYCSKNKDNFELLESDEDAEEKRNYFHVYIPTAIILISQFSYFTILKECLSCIFDSLIKTESFQATLENFAFRLTHLPVPPKRFNRFNLILETCLYKEKIISIHPQDEFEYEVFDLSLKFLFNHMSIENIIHVILGCLSDSKILFISQDYRILTPVIQCLMKLIQPFKWLLAYVPLLPGPQLGYIEAPHPFIMGYCTDYENLIRQMEEDNEIMIIDLNNNEIISKRKLNNFPDNCTNLLKSKLLSIDLNYVENQKLCRITKTDLYLLERMEESLIRKLNFKICDAFLEFYVNIFGDLTLFIKKQTKKFNKIAYLDTINEKDLPFYKQVIDSSIFGFFINGFIKNITEEKPDLYNHKLKTMKSKLEKKDSKYEKLDDLDLINNFEKQITKIFQIPDNCAKIIEEITKDLEVTHLLPYKDSLYYLRGFFYISINQIKDGFRDLYQIDSKSLFPKDIIQDYILPTLSPNQIEMFQEQNFYKNCDEYKKLNQNDEIINHFVTSLNSVDLMMNEYEFLDDINFDDFVNKLDQLEIRVDIDTSERLFKALTLENSSKLDRLTFEIFIDVYQSKEAELKKINRFLPINKLRTIEFSLKVSPYSVVPNYGIGISVLTQKCLYFLEQGTNKRKVLTELKDIISIEKTQYSKGFFQSKPALKITTISQVVYISPDGEVSVWYLLLNELCSSFRIANETKDSSLIQYAAINVLLLDSLIQSGLNSTTNHSEDLERSIKYLSFYTFYKSDSTRLQMSTDAKKILHLRINPSSREYTSQSVESMIYVDIERYPTVWCAIGNRIKIFDAITWNDEIMDIKLETKITCLLHEPLNSKVWISTLDKYFYVMDVLTRSFIRRIQDHTDVIINISLFKKIDKVITASSNGEILVWDPERIEKTDTANLNELFQNKSKLLEVTTSRNYLILTSSSSIEILDEKLQHKETIKFKIGETYEKISCTCVSYDKDSDDEFLWVGNSTNGIVTVWNLNRFELVMRIGVEECNGYRSFLCVDDFIWAGSKDGRLMLFSSKYYECEKSFKAHKDTVRSLCFVEYNKFVISGAGSRDGSIAVWRSSIINRKTIAGSIGKMLSPENK